MGLAPLSGGHVTHGHQSDVKKIAAASIYFTTKSYHLNKNTMLIDYD